MKKTFICIFILGLLLLVLSSCDNDIIIVGMGFRQYPRLIYLANVDTELDFTDATVFHRLGNGYQEGDYPFVIDSETSVEHSIDFSMPGEYEVNIIIRCIHRQFLITFTIQVVDEETYNQLRE